MDLSFQAASEAPITGIELDVVVESATGLVAKDHSLFKKASSDPFVVVSHDGRKYGQTKVVKKTLSPRWNEHFKFNLGGRNFDAKRVGPLVLSIFDSDKMTNDDPMGEVRIDLLSLINKGREAKASLPVQRCAGCPNAKGELQVRVCVSVRRAVALHKGASLQIPQGKVLHVGLGWEMLSGGRAIDLDTSCVGVDMKGNILMDESVYFADLSNSNGSIRHSGDEREGDENLGGTGDDEIITINLDAVPRRVAALFFVATVATPNHTFSDVKSARIRVIDGHSGVELCRYIPALKGDNTALFVMRLARDKVGFVLNAIGDVDRTARDFGTLIPEIKGYCTDIVPGIKIDYSERIAVMRKGGTIRLRDYSRGSVPDAVCFGLSWDITNGTNIDLDASAILLDSNLNLLDLVYFGQLRSRDGSVTHGGDEREGDEKGDDEKIYFRLSAVNPAVAYMGIVINSYSGQELDDVKAAECHLFDQSTYADIARYKLSGTKELDKHTALVMGCLYRDNHTNEWCLRIISEAAQGRTAQDNVDELQNFLRRNPPQPVAPPRPVAQTMPTHLASTPRSNAELAAAGRLLHATAMASVPPMPPQ